MRSIILIVAIAGALAACGSEVAEDTPVAQGVIDGRGVGFGDGLARRASPEASEMNLGQDQALLLANAQAAAQDADALAAAGSLLAYRYGVGLELPAVNVAQVAEAHEAACRSAGAGVCQILGSTLTEYSQDNVHASLSLRAEPGWLAAFREGLKSDAEDADGRIVETTVSAEDLTRSIVDTEARLNTQLVLRERLNALLADRTEADVEELLAVERELARVQGDIDSATSQLEVMRRRVEMSVLDLSYASARQPFTRDTFAGLKRALGDFFYTLSDATGLVIYVIAFLIPFVILALPFLWLLRRWWRGRRARRAAERAAGAEA